MINSTHGGDAEVLRRGLLEGSAPRTQQCQESSLERDSGPSERKVRPRWLGRMLSVRNRQMCSSRALVHKRALFLGLPSVPGAAETKWKGKSVRIDLMADKYLHCENRRNFQWKKRRKEGRKITIQKTQAKLKKTYDI